MYKLKTKILIFLLTFISMFLHVPPGGSGGWCDAPELWQLKLQDPSSSIMEGILMFNKHLLFIVILIVCLVGWLLFNTIKNFDNAHNHKAAKFFHSNPLEIIWTSIPALVLLTIASPSFTLLYSMDEISEPDTIIKSFRSSMVLEL